MLERCKYSIEMYCNWHNTFYRALNVVCLMLKDDNFQYFSGVKSSVQSARRDGRPQPYPGSDIY
jgi:hypothetical protein